MKSWQTVITFNSPQDAYLAKAFLESRGIQTVITDELTAQVYYLYANAIGGVKVKVAPDDIEEAIQILKEGGYILEGEYENREIEYIYLDSHTDKTICPYCKSRNIGYKIDPNYLTVVVFFLLGAFFPIFRRSRVCFECNRQWKYRKWKR